MRFMLTVGLTIIGLLLALNNADYVSVHLVIGSPVHIRLVFVLFLAGLGGYLIRHFIGVFREAELNQRLQREKLLQRRTKSVPSKE